MKKIILFLHIASIIFLNSAASAQKLMPSPEPCWIIESNVRTPKQSIVYFYSTNHVMMYKEIIEGNRLNINRPRIRKVLNATLKEVTLAWKQKRQIIKGELSGIRKF
jgi:hypothetical protein